MMGGCPFATARSETTSQNSLSSEGSSTAPSGLVTRFGATQLATSSGLT